MGVHDEEFLRRLRATFRQEADEHLRAMSDILLEFERMPEAPPASDRLEAVFRHAHSLKGAARACGFASVETICQMLEDVFAACKRRGRPPGPRETDALLRALDLLRRLTAAEGGLPDPADSDAIAAVRQLLSSLPTTAAAAPEARPAAPPAAPEAAPSRPEPGRVEVVTRPAEDTIRVSTAKLDRLILATEELLVVKQSLAQRADALRAFDSLLAEWDRRWAGVQSHLREQPGGIDAVTREFLDWNLGCVETLASRLRGLAKVAELDRRETSRRIENLSADSRELVLFPFSTIADVFPRLMRDLAREQGKEIDLVIRGGEVEIDKRILEEIKDPLIHLLRNSVDHGIEKPAVRTERRKSRRATVLIAVAATEDNKVEITVSDDGGGVDPDAVRAAAIRRSIVTTAEAAALDSAGSLDLIFRSDVSTSPMITAISGRGLGLAIVREKVEKLGGRVTLESTPRLGTTFRLLLPVALTTFRGLLVRSAGQLFVFPLAQVERVGRHGASDFGSVQNRETVRITGRTLPMVSLQRILGLPPAPGRTTTDARTLVVAGSGDSRVAFDVDEVLHDEEVLVKAIGRPLSRVRNIAGATVLGSGRVVPILHVGDLLKSSRRAESAPAAASPAETDGPSRAILVAEDSITSRMLLKGILESAGYRVTTAVDGIDALTQLRTGEFDLVVSDIEMPRMTGFDLTAAIRADRRLAETPVVLVTALASPADRERGIDVGANAYIVKSDFDQSDLLEVVRRLTR